MGHGASKDGHHSGHGGEGGAGAGGHGLDDVVREPLVPEPPLERIVMEMHSHAFGMAHDADGGGPLSTMPSPTTEAAALQHLFGADIVRWMMEQLWCSGRARALQLGQLLVHAGYLVPVHADGHAAPGFVDDVHHVYRLDETGGGGGDDATASSGGSSTALTPEAADFDFVVIGAGVAGLSAATFAAKLGVRVAVIDRRLPGGDNLWTASVPSKALCHIAKTVHACRHAGGMGLVMPPGGLRVDMSLVRSHIARTQAEVYKDITPAALAKKGCDIITGTASFVDARTLEVSLAEDELSQLTTITSARSLHLPPTGPAPLASSYSMGGWGGGDGSVSPIPNMPAAAIAAAAYTRGRSWSAASRLGGYAQPYATTARAAGSDLSPAAPGVGAGGGAAGGRSPTQTYPMPHAMPPGFSLPTIGEGKERSDGAARGLGGGESKAGEGGGIFEPGGGHGSGEGGIDVTAMTAAGHASGVQFHPLGVAGHLTSLGAHNSAGTEEGGGGGGMAVGLGGLTPTTQHAGTRSPPGPPSRAGGVPVPPLATGRMASSTSMGAGAPTTGRRKVRMVKAHHILIATGSNPTPPADIAGLDVVPYHTTDTVFDNAFLPRRLVVIGGGPAGVEIAQAYSRLGSEVTIIAPALLPREDGVVRDVLRRMFYKERILHVPSRAVRVEHRPDVAPVPAPNAVTSAAATAAAATMLPPATGALSSRLSFSAGRPVSPEAAVGQAGGSVEAVTSGATSPGAQSHTSTGGGATSPLPPIRMSSSSHAASTAGSQPQSRQASPSASPVGGAGMGARAPVAGVTSSGFVSPTPAPRSSRAASVNQGTTGGVGGGITGPITTRMTSRGSFSGRLTTGGGRGDDATGLAPIIVHTASGEQYTADMLVVVVGRSPNIHALNLAAAGVTAVTPPCNPSAVAAAAFPPSPSIKVNNHLQTSQRHVYAAGDVVDARNAHAHVAAWQGFHAARNALLPGTSPGVAEVCPHVTYTDPEIASVGLTPADAMAKYGSDKVRVVTRDGEDMDRARIDGDTHGIVSLTVGKDGTILGVTMVGGRASEVISEVSLAMTHHLKAADVALTLHAYPTYASIWHAAACSIATDAYVASTSTVSRLMHWGGSGSGGGSGMGSGFMVLSPPTATSSGAGGGASARVVPHPASTGPSGTLMGGWVLPSARSGRGSGTSTTSNGSHHILPGGTHASPE